MRAVFIKDKGNTPIERRYSMRFKWHNDEGNFLINLRYSYSCRVRTTVGSRDNLLATSFRTPSKEWSFCLSIMITCSGHDVCRRQDIRPKWAEETRAAWDLKSIFSSQGFTFWDLRFLLYFTLLPKLAKGYYRYCSFLIDISGRMISKERGFILDN